MATIAQISPSDNATTATAKMNTNFQNLNEAIGQGGGGATAMIDYDRNVKAVAHRGYSVAAPENTIPAYRLAKEMGFTYVETDVSFTSDGIPVCLHDSTIDRTSNGTGTITNMTFAQVRQYDFGSWFSQDFAGTQIPSLEEFLVFCKRAMLHPYIELKDSATYTEAQIQSLVDLVEATGMKGRVTWISFQPNYLTYVKNYDAHARLGYLLSGTITDAKITTALGLKTDYNEVFVDANTYTSANVSKCLNAGLPLEVWTIDSEDTIIALDKYITGVTSNETIAGKVLYDNVMDV